MRTQGKRAARGRVALGVGIAVLVAGSAAASAPAAPRVLGTNGVPAGTLLAEESGTYKLSHCQEGERLPRGANALRLSIRSPDGPGPIVRVRALLAERPFARGARAAGWTETDVVVPLRHAVRRTTTARLCLTIGSGTAIDEMGLRVMPAGRPSGPHLRVDYLQLGRAQLASAPADTRAPPSLLNALLALVRLALGL